MVKPHVEEDETAPMEEVLTFLLSKLGEGGHPKLLCAQRRIVPDELARQHYREHEGRDYYPPTVAGLSEKTALAAVIEGEDIVQRVRTLLGSTRSSEAAPGTVRSAFGSHDPAEVFKNAAHASATREEAHREIVLWLCRFPAPLPDFQIGMSDYS